MRRFISLFLMLLLAACGSEKSADHSSAVRSEAKALTVSIDTVLSRLDRAKYQEGELLVKFRTGVIQASAAKLHQKTGSSVIKRFAMISDLEHIKLPASLSVREAISFYMSNPNVEYAEPNYIKHFRRTVNDPLFNLQWALLNTGQLAGATPGSDISATAAWDIGTGSADMVIAVIDTGIDSGHPDLSANVWTNPVDGSINGVDEDGNGKTDDIHGWNFVSNNNTIMDDNGHGTHVSGIAGASGNNSRGVSGLMWQVKLMPLKILDAAGNGTIADEIAAIQYALDKHVRIMNASFTGGDYSQAEFDAINAAKQAGSLLITAAGNGIDGVTGTNNDTTGAYPANYALSNIISVASTDQGDRRSLFSNYGLNSVHVGAPGEEILSTYPAILAPSGYLYESGTSMSAPYVSALAGLLMSQYSHFTASQVRGTILRYVDSLPSLQGATITGGRVNAFRALSSLLPPSEYSLSTQPAGTVRLTWKDNAAGEDGYMVERKAGSGLYTAVASLPANASEFTDSSLSDGISYSYRIKAFNSLPNPPETAGIPAVSAVAELTSIIPLNVPTGLQAAAISSSGITVSWTDNSTAEEGYEIERKDPSGGFLKIATTGPNSTSFTDSGLSPQTTYTYHVRAFNSVAGNSAYSNDVSVTTFSVSQSGTGGGGGGGGCSIGSRKNTVLTAADGIVMLIPLLITLIARRKRN
ncbi:MAG: S8 family serine peptidase [Nitrospirae bacterium]|nr:S8 family serine peptidase [Nitrospirota bacterium]